MNERRQPVLVLNQLAMTCMYSYNGRFSGMHFTQSSSLAIVLAIYMHTKNDFLPSFSRFYGIRVLPTTVFTHVRASSFHLIIIPMISHPNPTPH